MPKTLPKATSDALDALNSDVSFGVYSGAAGGNSVTLASLRDRSTGTIWCQAKSHDRPSAALAAIELAKTKIRPGTPENAAQEVSDLRRQLAAKEAEVRALRGGLQPAPAGGAPPERRIATMAELEQQSREEIARRSGAVGVRNVE